MRPQKVGFPPSFEVWPVLGGSPQVVLVSALCTFWSRVPFVSRRCQLCPPQASVGACKVQVQGVRQLVPPPLFCIAGWSIASPPSSLPSPLTLVLSLPAALPPGAHPPPGSGGHRQSFVPQLPCPWYAYETCHLLPLFLRSRDTFYLTEIIALGFLNVYVRFRI